MDWDLFRKMKYFEAEDNRPITDRKSFVQGAIAYIHHKARILNNFLQDFEAHNLKVLVYLKEPGKTLVPLGTLHMETFEKRRLHLMKRKQRVLVFTPEEGAIDRMDDILYSDPIEVVESKNGRIP